MEFCLFWLLPFRRTTGDFLLSCRIIFVDLTSRLRQLPLHWDICTTVRPIANCLQDSSPVMEAWRAAALICEVGFWERSGVGLEWRYEEWIETVKTLSTHELHWIEHFNHPGNALISFVAALRLLRSSAMLSCSIFAYLQWMVRD